MDKTEASTSADKNKQVMEAVAAGLLQVHKTAPNTKQQGYSGYSERIATALTTGLEATISWPKP